MPTTDKKNGFRAVGAKARWNVALTNAEARALEMGASPLTIRPGALVEYWPALTLELPGGE